MKRTPLAAYPKSCSSHIRAISDISQALFSTTAKKLLVRGTPATAQYDGIFLILDQEDLYTGETLDLPETLCVRLRFRGSHAEAHAQYRKLLDYIEKHQMQMIGFSREIALIDYGITNDTEKFVTEICIPVRCE